MKEALEPRYRFIRPLGRGGMGSVDLVYDAVREEEVARKRILRVSASSRIALKREFRAIEQLRHPGLVALYELDEDAEGPFFTMEVVHGKDLLEHCGLRSAPVVRSHVTPIDRHAETRTAESTFPGSAVASLSSTSRDSTQSRSLPVSGAAISTIATLVPQVAAALAFLHSYGVVHCDLKPSNVLVRDDGVVKVLDFGILAETRTSSGRRSEIAGTAGYVAPERLRGEPVTPSVDLYALGCILYELYTGSMPFVGTEDAIIAQHLSAAPPKLTERRPDVPASHAQLCASLLQKSPNERATVADVQRVFCGEPARDESMLARAPNIVGREAVQANLVARFERAMAGACGFVALVGPSGAGKTTLADWLGEHAARSGTLTVHGRGRPTDRLAFNAVDGAMDELASLSLLRTMSVTDDFITLQSRAGALFPVLLGRGSFPAAVTRADAFDAIVGIVRMVANRSGLLIILDDLQWADDDSLALLAYLVEQAPPRVLVLATLRDDVERAPAHDWVRARSEDMQLPLGRLNERAVRAIIERVTVGKSIDEAAIAKATHAADGRPFLAELAGRWLLTDHNEGAPASWVQNAVGRASTEARRALAYIASEDGWLAIGDLAELLELRLGQTETVIRELSALGLIRRAGAAGPEGRVDVYHDVLRSSVIDSLGAASIVAAHDNLATLCMQRGDAATFALVRHLLGARRAAEAAPRARLAAARAESQRAYGLAAEMYAVAMSVEVEDRAALLRARGSALERVGKYDEAAQCWAAARRHARSVREGTDLMVREAQSLLGANRIDEGYRALGAALEARGHQPLGKLGFSGMWAGISFVIGPIGKPPQLRSTVSDVDRERAESDVRTASLAAFFDPVSGIRLLRRVRTECERAGAVEEAAWCDYLFAYMAMLGSAKPGIVPLAERYRAYGDSRFPTGSASKPEVRMAARLVDCLTAWRQANWEKGISVAEEMLDTVESAGLSGTHSHLLALMMRTEIEMYRQDFIAFERQFARCRAIARDLGDTGMRCQFALLEALLIGYRGETNAAIDFVNELKRLWATGYPTFQRMLIDGFDIALTYLNGDLPKAHRLLHEYLRTHRAYRPESNMYSGGNGAWGSLIEVRALRAGVRGASARRVRRFAALAQSSPPLMVAMSWRALAYLEEHLGRPEKCLLLLEQAEEVAGRLGHGIDVACAQYQRGKRLGGDEGAALIARARVAVAALGVSERMLEADSVGQD